MAKPFKHCTDIETIINSFPWTENEKNIFRELLYNPSKVPSWDDIWKVDIARLEQLKSQLINKYNYSANSDIIQYIDIKKNLGTMYQDFSSKLDFTWLSHYKLITSKQYWNALDNIITKLKTNNLDNAKKILEEYSKKYWNVFKDISWKRLSMLDKSVIKNLDEKSLKDIIKWFEDIRSKNFDNIVSSQKNYNYQLVSSQNHFKSIKDFATKWWFYFDDIAKKWYDQLENYSQANYIIWKDIKVQKVWAKKNIKYVPENIYSEWTIKMLQDNVDKWNIIQWDIIDKNNLNLKDFIWNQAATLEKVPAAQINDFKNSIKIEQISKNVVNVKYDYNGKTNSLFMRLDNFAIGKEWYNDMLNNYRYLFWPEDYWKTFEIDLGWWLKAETTIANPYTPQVETVAEDSADNMITSFEYDYRNTLQKDIKELVEWWDSKKWFWYAISDFITKWAMITNSFILSRLEQIKDYVPELYEKYLKFQDSQYTIAEKLSPVMDRLLKTNKKTLKEFANTYKANEDKYIIALMYKDRLYKPIWEIIESNKTYSELLRDIVDNNPKLNYSNELWKFKKLKEDTRAEKSLDNLWFFAGVLDELKISWYVPNIVWVKNVLSEINKVYDILWDEVYKFYKDAYWITTPESEINFAGMIRDLYFKQNKLNLRWVVIDSTASMKLLDDLNKKLKNFTPTNVDTWLLNIKNIEEYLSNKNLSDTQKQKIYEDLTWQSIYWWSSFMKKMSALRWLAYFLELWLWSPKWYIIASQNFLSWKINQLTNYSTIEKQSSEYFNLLETIKKDQDFADMQSRLFSDNVLLNNAWKQREIDSWATKIYDNLTWLFYDMMAKVGKDKMPFTKSGFQSVLKWPVWVADWSVEKTWLSDAIYNKIMEDKWLSANDLNMLYKQKLDLDKQISKTSWVEQKSLENQKKELVRQIENIFNSARQAATAEYQTFFKSAQQSWIMRNDFSRWIFLNFFSVWGSKKLWEWLQNILVRPLYKANLAYRITWNAQSAARVYMSNLLSNDFMWLLKSSLYFSRMMYELDKDESYDVADNDSTANKMKNYLYWSPYWQAVQSFVLTRGAMEWVKWYGAWKEAWLTTQDSILNWLNNATYNILSNILKELKFISNPLAWAYMEAVKNPSATPTDIANAMLDKFLYTFNNSMYYAVSDLYAGLDSKRLDDWWNWWMLDLAMWWSFTKYKQDINKLMDAWYLEKKIKDWKLNINFLDTISWAIFWFPKSYEDRIAYERLKNISDNDKWVRSLKQWDTSVLTKEQKIKAMDLLFKQTLEWQFNLDDTKKSELDWKVALIMNDLQSKWIDIKWLSYAINSWNLKSYEKEMAILKAESLTKADNITLLAYLANKAYVEWKKLAKEKWIKLSDEDLWKEFKNNIMLQIADSWVISNAMNKDKQYASEVIVQYLRDNYWWTIPWLTASWKWADSDIMKKYSLALLWQLADWRAINWNREKLDNVWARILQDVSDKNLPKKTAEFFDFIDWLSWVSNEWKSTAKAWILYGNIKRLKTLLNSPYAPWMSDEMNNLANIIWQYWRTIDITPAMIDALWDNASIWTGWKAKKWTAPKTKNIDLQKDVVNKIWELRDSIGKNPNYAQVIKDNIIKQAWYGQLSETILPDITKIKTDEWTRIKSGTIKTESIKTEWLKTAESKSVAKKWKWISKIKQYSVAKSGRSAK